jgi:hypothetical protein
VDRQQLQRGDAEQGKVREGVVVAILKAYGELESTDFNKFDMIANREERLTAMKSYYSAVVEDMKAQIAGEDGYSAQA